MGQCTSNASHRHNAKQKDYDDDSDDFEAAIEEKMWSKSSRRSSSAANAKSPRRKSSAAGYMFNNEFFVHDVVKKSGCETFVIDFEQESSVQVAAGAGPKKLRPLRRPLTSNPSRLLRVRPDSVKAPTNAFIEDNNRRSGSSSSKEVSRPSSKLVIKDHKRRLGLRSAFSGRKKRKESEGNVIKTAIVK
jgi:hypothetical protein